MLFIVIYFIVNQLLAYVFEPDEDYLVTNAIIEM